MQSLAARAPVALILASLALAPAARAEEILVDLQDDISDAQGAALEKRFGIKLSYNSPQSHDERLYVAKVAKDKIAALLKKLSADPLVEAAEENTRVSLEPPPELPATEALPITKARRLAEVPNDPMWQKQWSFRLINVSAAWADADGDGVTVAVIDTGVAYRSAGRFVQVEDLAQTEFVPGYNFVDDNDQPYDDHGHGTHVAGTIAQSTNNELGVAGLAPKAKIMPIKVLGARGGGTTGDIADAIRFAADEGAQVINLSLGGGLRSRIMASAVAYARNKGVIVVAAAGNNGRGKVEYPAAYPGAIAVSSVGPKRRLAGYSSFGKQIALSAPGGDKRFVGGGILQNTITPAQLGKPDQYLSFQGTSMATPHVAAAAALVISTGLTNADRVEAVLRATAQDAGPEGWDKRYGDGILDVGAAVQAAQNEVGGLVHLGAGLVGLAGLAFSFRRRLALGGAGLAALVGVAYGSSGLGIFAGGLAGLGIWLFGPAGGDSALWLSFLPVLLLTIATLRVPRLRGLMMGLAIGYAAYLFVSALVLPMDVEWMWGEASWADRTWLLLNALFLAGLAHALNHLRAN